MKAITPADMRWLRDNFPNLSYDARQRRIEGEIDFCASWDKLSRRLSIKRNGRVGSIRQSSSFIADVYEVEIQFDSESLSANGWPRVYEVGDRHTQIARKYGVRTVDLHFFSDDDSCYLGISPNPPRGACERPPEEAKGCTSESEIMVLQHKTCHRKGAPNRCYHVTTLTASKSPSTIPAW